MKKNRKEIRTNTKIKAGITACEWAKKMCKKSGNPNSVYCEEAKHPLCNK